MEDDTNVIDIASIAARAKQRAADLANYDLTEDGIALAFADAHKHELRYDHTRGAWYRWTGVVWLREETRLALDWAREVCRRFVREMQAQGKGPASLGKSATALGVERFAQSAREFAVTSTIWDTNKWLLGTPGGKVDLRTGDLLPPDHLDCITRLTSVAPAATPHCPAWDKFLLAATAGDMGLIRFLRQWCGYMLTGDTREHALLFIFGPGGNGKSVFINTVSGIMADYARNSPMDTFTASASDKHPTDLAMLKGARMVSASETEEGRAWAEVRIKQLTGGDIISARFMRQDFFEFVPEFKLVVIGNHKPLLRNVDDAARRRFNVVPFTNTPAEPDRNLEAKLREEWPGILRWMIEGCLDWQMNSLKRPEVVLSATAEYFSEQDSIQQWIEDHCNVGDHEFETAAFLFKDWSAFAVASGERPGTTKWFTQVLLRHGCMPIKNTPGEHGKRGVRGISVKRNRDGRGQDD